MRYNLPTPKNLIRIKPDCLRRPLTCFRPF